MEQRFRTLLSSSVGLVLLLSGSIPGYAGSAPDRMDVKGNRTERMGAGMTGGT